MPTYETIAKDLQARLQRIEGQVRGVERMISRGDDPTDVVTQLSAISAAVARAADQIRNAHIQQILGEKASADLIKLLDRHGKV